MTEMLVSRSLLVLLVLLVLVVLTVCGVTSAVPRVTLDQGALRGKTMTSRKGITFLAFQGIPYAAPPVGNLRFKAPQETPAWIGDRLALHEGSDCMQMHVVFHWATGKEDCLYLNVYTPKLEREGAGLSVMVWIHGGGFHSSSGSSESYGPQFLLDNNIVLVTFNYRLGPLGFLSLGTAEAPGNYGLKDQVAALRWVKKNIDKFGGNPDSVTIFGESAGAVGVHLLMLSPLARGLFHRAIAQSGSAYNPWAIEREPAAVAQQAATALGCKRTNDTSVLGKCLRSVEAHRLVKLELALRNGMMKKAIFVPTVEPAGTEGAFLTEDPRSMLARGDISDVPLMAGLTTHEGMLEFMLLRNRSLAQAHADNYESLVPEELGLRMAKDSPEWGATWQRIEQFYHQISGGNFFEHFLLLNSDVDFVLGVDEMVRGVAALQRSPVFYYQFSYDGGLGVLKKFVDLQYPGTAHTDDLSYMFTRSLLTPILLLSASQTDLVTIDRVTKMWTDFAKSGNPTPDGALGVSWDPVEAPLNDPKMAATRYLDIGAQLVMTQGNLNAERVAFWQNLRDSPVQRLQLMYPIYMTPVFQTYPLLI